MSYTVHLLDLKKSIPHPGNQTAVDGTEKVLTFESTVEKNNLEPLPEQHLVGEGAEAEITPGMYLFSQKVLHDESGTEQFRAASEAIWLEALWREVELDDRRVFLRILSEDGKRVFQIFRKIRV